MKPLMVDLFCGLGGWSDGGLAEGYNVVGFDIEAHRYGEARYPAQLVIQDVLTIHGSQFKDADLIVASPPCQEFSYMAMPWTRAKQIARGLRGEGDFPAGYKGSRTRAELTALFDACFRIQKEAIAAAGHFIPMVVENVRGACPWVGKSRWNFGSFHLWGDVPALMPIVTKRRMKSRISCATRLWSERVASTPEEAHALHYRMPSEGAKVPGFRFDGSGKSFQTASVEGSKNDGGSWFAIGSPGQKVTGKNPVLEAQKTIAHVNKRDGHSHTRHLTNQREHDAVHALAGIKGSEGYERDHPQAFGGKKPNTSSHSTARKAASAQIAKIPLALSRHIASVYKQ